MSTSTPRNTAVVWLKVDGDFAILDRIPTDRDRAGKKISRLTLVHEHQHPSRAHLALDRGVKGVDRLSFAWLFGVVRRSLRDQEHQLAENLEQIEVFVDVAHHFSWSLETA